jgi:DNA-binding PadR family transcriptional regulator
MSPLECNILSLLVKEGKTFCQNELMKWTKSSTGGISKAIGRLEDKGLIFTIKDVINFYGINPYRKQEVEKFIMGYQIGKNKPLILSGHAFYFEAELNDLPNKLLKTLEKDKSFIGYLPSGWRYASRCFLPDGVFKLIKTKSGSRLIAHFRTFGTNAKIIEAINQEKFLRIKSELENKYLGLKIGNTEIIAICPWQEYAIQKDLITIAGIALGIKHKKIEQSYKYPEWEEKGFNAREKIEKIIRLRQKELEILGLEEPVPIKEEQEVLKQENVEDLEKETTQKEPGDT